MPSRADATATPGWVLVAELGPEGHRLSLGDEDSRYVARVCRAREGERLTLTDGRGGLAVARVRTLRPRVEVEIERSESVPAVRTAHVLCGAPEGMRADWLVEKIAELGVGAFHPVDCARSSWDAHGARAERWERLAAAALRQSRGCWRMTIEPVRPLAQAIDELGERTRLCLADAEGRPANGVEPGPSGRTAGVIGPATGLDEAEKTWLARRGAVPIRLAARRLRTETAAVVWAGWWAGADAECRENP